MTLYTDLCCLRVDCIVKGKNKNSILFCTNLGTLLRKFVVLWVVSDWQMNWVCWYFVKYQINQNQISDSVTPLTIKAAMKCPSKRLTANLFRFPLHRLPHSNLFSQRLGYIYFPGTSFIFLLVCRSNCSGRICAFISTFTLLLLAL